MPAIPFSNKFAEALIPEDDRFRASIYNFNTYRGKSTVRCKVYDDPNSEEEGSRLNSQPRANNGSMPSLVPHIGGMAGKGKRIKF